MPTARWLLPEAIEDILPTQAWQVEVVRRGLLDLFRGWGYELVQTPLIEYLESLLTGSGRDLDLQTFKLVDQLSGRTMGLRADITPQVARVDAHLLNRAGVVRLCYCGSVVHALPASLTANREPLQIGAEIYGHEGIEADVEVLGLLAVALDKLGMADARVDFGHVDIFRSLITLAGLGADREGELFQALQAKDMPEVRQLVADVEGSVREALLALPNLYGDATVLSEARRVLPDVPDIRRALDVLERLAAATGALQPGFDLADLRGYRYHTGVVFAAYCGGYAGAIARGGRYDSVGRAFGRARPATGFSMDLREVLRVARLPEPRPAVLAPVAAGDDGLREAVAALRQAGEVVVETLPGHEGDWHETGCDRRLVRRDGRWVTEGL